MAMTISHLRAQLFDILKHCIMRYIIYNEEENKKLGGILQMANKLKLWFELVSIAPKIVQRGRLYTQGGSLQSALAK
jgi:hypothetical protein